MIGEQKLMDSNFILAQVGPIANFLIFQNLCALCQTYIPKKKKKNMDSGIRLPVRVPVIYCAGHFKISSTK